MTSAVDDLIARSGAGCRSDARRNVERLVAAARSALDEEALGVTTRAVAKRAGVGLGTLYRRVPSLDSLLSAILADTIGEMTDQAVRARDDPDPWAGFVRFAETYVQLRAASCGLHAALGAANDAALDAAIGRLRAALRRLVRHAQQAGAVRADLDWRDVPFALATAIPTDHTIGLEARSDQWRRNLAIILEGLRAPTAPGSATS